MNVVLEKDNRISGYSIYSVLDIDITNNIGIIISVSENNQSSVIDHLKDLGKYNAANVYCQKIIFTKNENIITEKDWYKGVSRDGIYYDKFSDLDRIGKKYGTDKCSDKHSYLRKYESFIQCYKDSVFTMIELGVYTGQSINMWADYFDKAQIIGVDINPDCQNYSGNNKQIIITDLSRVKNIEKLNSYNPLIILDDASHIWSHQILSLCVLYKSLKSGGVYIIEDIGTSFLRCKQSEFSDSCISAYEFCRAVCDVVTGAEIVGAINKYKEIKKMVYHIAKDVDMISFIYGSVIIVKK